MSKKTTTQTRVYKSQTEKIHDLYKLEVTTAKKDVSWDGNPTYVAIEHCHFFHSVDSSGNPQTNSTVINGHFHIMELIKPATETEPAVYKCSGPKKWVIQEKNGQRRRVMQSALGHDDYGKEIDNHTHEVAYVQSQKLIPRKPNMEAAKLQAQIAAKFEQSMPGVIG